MCANRTECARERAGAPGVNSREGPGVRLSTGMARRGRAVGRPTPSAKKSRRVVEAKAGHLHDGDGSPDDLSPLRAEKPSHAEVFDREGGHHATIRDGRSEGSIAEAAHAREGAEEPAREGVSGAGRIDHALDREGRAREVESLS